MSRILAPLLALAPPLSGVCSLESGDVDRHTLITAHQFRHLDSGLAYRNPRTSILRHGLQPGPEPPQFLHFRFVFALKVGVLILGEIDEALHETVPKRPCSHYWILLDGSLDDAHLFQDERL